MPDNIYIDGKLIVEYTDEDIIIYDWDKKIVMMNKNIGAKKPWLDEDSYGDYFTFDEAKNKAPEWYHVPESREIIRVVDTLIKLWVMDNVDNWSILSNVLLLPFAGNRSYNRPAKIYNQGAHAYYWSSSMGSTHTSYVDFGLYNALNRYHTNYQYGFSLRCFKDF
jgi:uncharacterized protein (TIGR02145 family)